MDRIGHFGDDCSWQEGSSTEQTAVGMINKGKNSDFRLLDGKTCDGRPALGANPVAAGSGVDADSVPSTSLPEVAHDDGMTGETDPPAELAVGVVDEGKGSDSEAGGALSVDVTSVRTCFKLSEIEPNPFRRLDLYPVQPDKIEALKGSIDSTGFWDNLVARPKPGNPHHAEIAYGHNRLEALDQLYGQEYEVSLVVRDLSDELMLKIMAAENMDEWSSSALVTLETVRAVVDAHATRQIQLPEVPKKTPKRRQRCAPSFLTGADDRCPDSDHREMYTSETVARFLKWNVPKVKLSLQILEAVEEELIAESDLTGLSLKAAGRAARRARKAQRAPDLPDTKARQLIRAVEHILPAEGDKSLTARIHAAQSALAAADRDALVDALRAAATRANDLAADVAAGSAETSVVPKNDASGTDKGAAPLEAAAGGQA